MWPANRRKVDRSNVRAVAIVEMAVVMPLLLTMLFGMIEFGWLFMVNQNLTSAAREACRIASLEGTSDADVANAIADYLQNTGISTYLNVIFYYNSAHLRHFVDLPVFRDESVTIRPYDRTRVNNYVITDYSMIIYSHIGINISSFAKGDIISKHTIGGNGRVVSYSGIIPYYGSGINRDVFT